MSKININKTTEDTHTATIEFMYTDEHGDRREYAKVANILFHDGEFVRVDYQLSCPYTRVDWIFLGKLAKVIEELCEEYNTTE